MQKQKKPAGFFITGTDTGVGKTVIGTTLVSACLRQGYSVFPRKPVETACTEQGGRLLPADGQMYAEAIQRSQSLDSITPHCFKAAVSAERAAYLEGTVLKIADLHEAVIRDVPDDGLIIAEGAGGLLSPLTSEGSNAEFAMALGFPLILVTGDRLGCINHTLLTLEAAARRQLTVAVIILNNGNNTTDMDNMNDIKCKTTIPVIKFPTISNYAADVIDQAVDNLMSILNLNIDCAN